MQKSFLDIKNLKIAFNLNGKFLYAVNGVDLNITQGETLGLVGESGCGKSITAFSILNLLPEKVCRVENDSIIFNDTDLSTYSNQDMRNIRGNEIGIVFQDALASLDPVFTIGYQLIEAI
ncbi:MAG: ABC transporter ATP-binding protein, partial [Spirochaetes bacterium]|nr:ABC transporter ATP-binding protein [Spirochaetota bacterium]